MPNICDKCEQLVEPSNDAALLELLLGDVSAMFATSRHLLPTSECEGSPSRAQYIEGQPRDPRGIYGYFGWREIEIREAHTDLLRIHA